jgi:AraC-like DNA-binding protein
MTTQLSGKTGDGFQFRCEPTVEQYITQTLINNHAPSILTMKSCLYAVLEAYLKQITLIDKTTKELRVISLISDYIQKYHAQKVTLSDLATNLGYDYNYMSRFFRNTFNMTFSDFVNIYRLETATKLLEDTYESVADIALKSGFQSVRAFNTFFKKNTGISPSEYRRASRR